MELLKLLENVPSSFTDIKELLESEPYNLIIKEDNELYMITYDRNISNMNNSVVKQCRGIILEKESNKIVCYTFNKSLDDGSQLDWDTTKIERSVDGTQIRLFYYNNEWKFATTRCINADRAKWFSKQSFYEMYKDCGEVDYDKLNKNYCYSFVICHPNNRIVVNYSTPKLVHVLTRDLQTLEEVECDIGIEKPQQFTNFNTLEDVINDCNTNDSFEEGYMLCDKNSNRLKVKNANYMKIKDLRGNTNNMFYRYLQLRYDGLIEAYLSFYPEFKGKFMLYELDIYNLAKEIQRQYMNRRVHNVEVIIPQHFKTMIYKLHGTYLETREKTTVHKVMEELNKLHPSQICFMYNRTFVNQICG